MSGAGIQFTRSRGEDRFYNPAKARRSYRNRTATQPVHTTQSDVVVKKSPLTNERSVDASIREPENRTLQEEKEFPKTVAEPAPPLPSPLTNLEQFLESVTPVVPPKYLYSKIAMRRGWDTCHYEYQPYFVLGDLWESFKEWSAYGAGVPLLLNDSDSVFQYYVPFLSGIQIYRDVSKSLPKLWRSREDSESDFRDSSSDGSSDCETYMREPWKKSSVATNFPLSMDMLNLRDHHAAIQNDFSSDDGQLVECNSSLYFEYLERDPPYSREPLADKIADISSRFPEVKTLRSCDLFSSSWMSVAWYPIYRIPTGPTLKDLDACFLTYHSLSTPVQGNQGVQRGAAPVMMHLSEIDGVPKISLPVFGLSSYKLKGSLWTRNDGHENMLAGSLLMAAENWLRLHHVNHPDFLFFSR